MTSTSNVIPSDRQERGDLLSGLQHHPAFARAFTHRFGATDHSTTQPLRVPSRTASVRLVTPSLEYSEDR